MNNLRVVIVSDDHLVRAGLSTLLDAQEQVEVVGSQESDASLARSLAAYRPDAILWDLGWDLTESLDNLLRQTEQDGLDRLETIDDFGVTDVGSTAPIVALIATPEQSRAIPRGSVQGLVMRDGSADQLTSGLAAAAAGLLVFSPECEEQIFVDEPRFTDELIEPLTPRETEILRLIAEGLANKAIARLLNISDHTVKFHTTSLYGKLGVSSRTEAVVRAMRLGLILL